MELLFDQKNLEVEVSLVLVADLVLYLFGLTVDLGDLCNHEI